LSDFAGAELLEVLQGQHFAVKRVHAVERFLHVDALFGLDAGLRRRGQFAQELRRQGCRVSFGQSAAVQRNLTVGNSQLRAKMATMHLRQLQSGHVSQPQKQGQLWRPRVFRQFLADLQKGFLHHIRIVHPSR
jgi:hypothetical protein